MTGAVLGAFWVVGLPKLFGDSVEIGLLTSGAGLLILLLYFPGGLVQVLYSVRDAAFAFLARRLPEPEPAPVERAAAARARQRRRGARSRPSLDAVIRVERTQRVVRPAASWSTTSTCTLRRARSSGSSARTAPASRR